MSDELIEEIVDILSCADCYVCTGTVSCSACELNSVNAAHVVDINGVAILNFSVLYIAFLGSDICEIVLFDLAVNVIVGNLILGSGNAYLVVAVRKSYIVGSDNSVIVAVVVDALAVILKSGVSC